MKQSSVSLTAIILLLAMVSCSKEKNNATAGADITGTYKFISSQAKTNTTVQSISGSHVSKTVTTSDYTTLNNAGTVTIDGNKFIMTNLAYSINSTANAILYEDGVVSGTFSAPIKFTLPPSSGTSTYKKISADSIYFESGSLLTGNATTASQPGGSKIKFENGILTMYGNFLQSSTSTNQGETVTSIGTAATVTTLQKQ